MPLTDTKIRNAKPRGSNYKLFDERGLFLLVTPSGGKWWRFKYRFDGKEKLLSLGTYPEVPLASYFKQNEATGEKQKIKGARELRDDARELLAQGINPADNRKALKSARVERAANSFETIAREWLALPSDKRKTSHAKRILGRLEKDVFPWIGGKPVTDIIAKDILEVARRVAGRGAIETAHRLKNYCGQVMRYAIQTNRAERDPTGDLRDALPTVRTQHRAAVTEPGEVADLLRTLDNYQGSLIVASALKLAPLVFVRPGELRQAEWAHIDMDAAEWRYMVTKTDTQHIVPLSKQAIAILKELHPLTGHGRFVFPSARSPRGDRPMSDNAILVAMRRLEISKDKMTGHGFRAMARTILDEILGFRPDLIEHQLAHRVRDPNGRAYNRTAHLPERHKMMQEWADYLEKIKAGAEVIPMPQRA